MRILNRLGIPGVRPAGIATYQVDANGSLGMVKVSSPSFELSWTALSAPLIDKYVIVPILACAFAAVISPLISSFEGPIRIQDAEPGVFNRILARGDCGYRRSRNGESLSPRQRLTWPPHVICLLVYVLFAGLSILWAFRI